MWRFVMDAGLTMWKCRELVLGLTLATLWNANPRVPCALGEEPPRTEQPADTAGLDPEHAAKLAQGLELFQREVREVLVTRCVKCHGEERAEGELDLTSRPQLLRAGANGAVVVPGKSAASRLVRLIMHREEPAMPEEGEPLSEQQIASISRWIDLGAPYDRGLLDNEEAPGAWTATKVPDEARSFWSFQPLAPGSPPEVAAQEGAQIGDWIQTAADRFVLARLVEHHLTPNPLADRRTLIRRACFDLIGLPPQPAEIETFIAEPSPDAYDRLLDRLLASPQYGERWGRHWLDLVRFAESSGFEHDGDRPSAYHYRDFVIRAFNSDLPYSDFVRWQLAGDELRPDDPLAMMATGFLAAGVFPTQLTEKEFEPARYDELDDMVGTMGTSMLALTIGCARCHDHKFDPIPAADYYRMVAVFTTTIRSEVELDPDAVGRVTPVLVASEGLKPLSHHADGRGFPHFYPETHFLKRGDVTSKYGVAAPGFLQVLSEPATDANRWSTTPPPGGRTSHRRRALADWIVDTECGAGNLLARVLVNRLWQHHLGRGIVATPNDFGAQGQRPTHPELLDWLAEELIHGEWQLKRLHRQIMASAAYRQTSVENPAQPFDPDNRWLTRFTPRRLEAEIIRDAMLEVSGLIDRNMFGPGTLDPAMRRRSIYFTVKRSQLVPVMQIFDAPEPLVSVGERPATTIAPQALMFLNNPEVRRYARSFAQRLLGPGFVADSTPDRSADQQSLASAARAAYLSALGREPDADQLAEAVAFIRTQVASYHNDQQPDATLLAVADFCQVLMSLNEFVFVE